MVTVIISIWFLACIAVLVWDNARKHHQIKDLRLELAMTRHPSNMSWECNCGAIILRSRDEISDGKGMTHRGLERCIPDLEVEP